jgi:exopolysaccharide biosynthesis polyprenyl glycosylphosphotransferase
MGLGIATETRTVQTADRRRRFGVETGAAERRRTRRIRRRGATFRRALAVADALAIAIVLLVGTTVLGDDRLTAPIAGALLALILLMKTVGLYDRDDLLLHKTTLDEVPALFQVATLSSMLLWLGGGLLVDGAFGQRQIFGMWALLFVLLIVGRSLARLVAARITPPERCLLIGDAVAADLFESHVKMANGVHAEFVDSMHAGFVEWAPHDNGYNGNGRSINGNGNGNGYGHRPQALPDELAEVLDAKQIDRVILAPGRLDTDTLLRLVRQVHALDVNVSVLPATPPVAGSSVEMDHINGLTLAGVRGFDMRRSTRVLKRSFDLLVSAMMLVLLSPLLLAVAIAIKLDSRGPVLFRQRRIGREGRPFQILKFRSMHDGAEHERESLMGLNETEGLFKISDDPRVTRVGKLIRRSSIDELPQLVNVLRGDMSLVGPRPLVPEEDSMVVGHYRRRLDIAPGMTGFWQALGGNRIPLSDMVRLDYLYVETWSLWNDIRILLRTVPHVVGRQGR